jgi:exopolyphosphatase/guanosine-5'-triphosphate,3'-diphosphate pyrophosphatase
MPRHAAGKDIPMIKRYAVISIGSTRCELIVGQRGKSGVNILDRAMFPLELGAQIFGVEII